MRPHSLAVIGLGAIGGSVAWQARVAGISRVVGYARDRPDRVAAIKAEAVDDIADDPLRAVAGADLVVLATPPQAVIELLETIGSALAPGALVTDVASTKAQVLEWARELLPTTVDFVGGHPMAGKEQSGAGAADSNLLHGAIYCLSPAPRTPVTAVCRDAIE